jgi:hypothetical protein
MRFYEISDNPVDDLVIVLRNQIKRANTEGSSAELSWQAISSLMSDMGHGEYSYDAFKSEYDSNPDLKSIVKNFNADGIVLNTRIDKPEQGSDGEVDDSQKSVNAMAKRATNKRF